MDDVRVFLSYARDQLYFPESLALNLQASGIPVWMDIQQLEPGSDWVEGIGEGLAGSTAVVLVASRKALDSPYVRQEWTAALNAQKPVYVAFFEFVQLPAALRDNTRVSYFNFRRSFARKVRQLCDSLKVAKTHRDAIGVWRFLLPPAAHWVVMASLLVPSLILLAWLVAILSSGFVYFPESLSEHFLREIVASTNLVALWVWVIGAGIVLAVGFLRRRFEVLTLRHIPWMLVIVLWFGYKALDPVTHGQSVFRVGSSDVPLYTDQFIVIWLGLGGLALASFQLQRKSSDILRWMPLGQAPTKMREAINARLVKDETRPSPGPVSRSEGTYKIFYHPADRDVAQEVEVRLRSSGYRRRDEASSEPAQMVVFVLSNYADLHKLKQAAGVLPEQAMALVATSIRMPESPEELFRYQWVDYRRRTSEQLARIDQLLRGEPASKLRSSFAIDPESLEKVVVPTGVFFVTNALRSLASLVLASGLYLLALLAMGRGGSWRGVPILALGTAMFWLGGRLSQRRIHERQFAAGYVVLWLAIFLLNVSGTLWVLFRNYGINIYTGQPTLWGYGYQAMVLLAPPAVAFYHRDLIARWLPQAVKDGAPSRSLQLRAPRMNWFVYSLGVLLVALALLASTQF